LAPVHRRYAQTIHARPRKTGHFWQGLIGAAAMDKAHLAAAVRYVARNPVRARLVQRAQDWP
jgi:putative transposase